MGPSNEPSDFELNIWGLHNSPDKIRLWHKACWKHDIQGLEDNYIPSWQDYQQYKLVDPLHLFACGWPRSGGLDRSRKALQWLLERGGSLEKQDASGWLPVNYAAWFGFASTMDLILEAGSPIQNRNNPQPLDSALGALAQKKQPGSETCARLLLMHGADPRLGNASDPSFGGLTWLTWALESHRWDWAECLWSKGCDVISDREIHLILIRGSSESLCWLQNKGVNILSYVNSKHHAFDDLMIIKAQQDKLMITQAIESIRGFDDFSKNKFFAFPQDDLADDGSSEGEGDQSGDKGSCGSSSLQSRAKRKI